MKRSLMLLVAGLCACGGGGGGDGGAAPDPVPGRLEFVAAGYAVDEDDGNAVITVRRSGGTDGPVSVTYTSSGGSATADADYAAVNGRISWPDGDSSTRSFQVPILNDSRREADETVALALSAADGGATLGGLRTATLTIRDDEPAQHGQLQFSAAGYTVAENGGSILILVSRSGGIDGGIGVSYATADGSARAGTDYTATSGTLGWLDGDDGTRGFFVEVADDAVLDGDRTVNLVLSDPSGGAGLGARRSVTLLIDDNEMPQPGQLQFGAANYEVAEDAAAATVTVTRSNGSDTAVSVAYASANGTARAGIEYTAVSGRLDWAAGDASPRTITVPVQDDALRDRDKALTLRLSAVQGGATIGGINPATLTIRDNEPPQAGQLQFSANTYAADEAAATATIAVTRSGGIDGAVSVGYGSTDGSALAGSDYTAASGRLTWADGDGATKTFAVALRDDLLVEGDETLALQLSSPAGAALGTRTTATLTIGDDDELPLALVDAFPALSFEEPVFLAAERGDDSRLYVVEKAGRIRVFPDASGTVASQVFLDIGNRVQDSGERGLLGLAFDPDFAANRHFYVHYIADNPVRAVVSRFTATTRDLADAGSEQVLLTFPRSSSIHNGGWIGFGPDGRLYVSSGDDGDPANAQRLDTLLGKVLRIGRDGSIPSDNPFVGTAGARAEIWAYGLRNPWRAGFDRQTGELWLGDVGQGTREEIDLVVAGGNYGWDVCEGKLCSGPPPPQYRPPLLDYGRDIGQSVNGGYVYRGAALPEVEGFYFFSDFISGRIWAARGSRANPLFGEVAMVDYPTSFGEDAAGELYVVTYGGKLFKLVRQ